MRSCLCYISVLFSVHPPRSPLPRSDFGSQLVGMLCATLSAQMKVCSPEVVGKLCATPSAQILHSAACRTAPRHSLSSENEGIISGCHPIPPTPPIRKKKANSLRACTHLNIVQLSHRHHIGSVHFAPTPLSPEVSGMLQAICSPAQISTKRDFSKLMESLQLTDALFVRLPLFDFHFHVQNRMATVESNCRK